MPITSMAGSFTPLRPPSTEIIQHVFIVTSVMVIFFVLNTTYILTMPKVSFPALTFLMNWQILNGPRYVIYNRSQTTPQASFPNQQFCCFQYKEGTSSTGCPGPMLSCLLTLSHFPLHVRTVSGYVVLSSESCQMCTGFRVYCIMLAKVTTSHLSCCNSSHCFKSIFF